MDIARTAAGLPPVARDEQAQRLRNGRGAEVAGDPDGARLAYAERAGDGRAGERARGLQTVVAVAPMARSDRAEPAGPSTQAPAPLPSRGSRLDLSI